MLNILATAFLFVLSTDNYLYTYPSYIVISFYTDYF